MTSLWARWLLKSSASRLFTQPFIQGADQRNIKAPRHWPLWGEFTGDRWIPRTAGSYRGKVSIWWCHYRFRNVECTYSLHLGPWGKRPPCFITSTVSSNTNFGRYFSPRKLVGLLTWFTYQSWSLVFPTKFGCLDISNLELIIPDQS